MSLPDNDDSFKLSEEDVLKIVRLIGDVAGLDADQAVQRRQLMESVADVVDADCWLWSMFRICDGDEGAMTIGLMHGGLSEKEIARAAAAETDPKLVKPETSILMELMSNEKHFTRRREQMVADDAWYADPHTKHYRQDWLDDCIYSIYPIDIEQRIFSGIGLHRAWGREPFTQRDARMVHILAAEVRWLHDAAVPGSSGEGTQKLARRLRPVLALLLDGQNRVQIADHLGLSVHTVADYTKEIYRHFNVSGAVRLMKHFMAGDGGDR